MLPALRLLLAAIADAISSRPGRATTPTPRDARAAARPRSRAAARRTALAGVAGAMLERLRVAAAADHAGGPAARREPAGVRAARSGPAAGAAARQPRPGTRPRCATPSAPPWSRCPALLITLLVRQRLRALADHHAGADAAAVLRADLAARAGADRRHGAGRRRGRRDRRGRAHAAGDRRRCCSRSRSLAFAVRRGQLRPVHGLPHAAGRAAVRARPARHERVRHRRLARRLHRRRRRDGGRSAACCCGRAGSRRGCAATCTTAIRAHAAYADLELAALVEPGSARQNGSRRRAGRPGSPATIWRPACRARCRSPRHRRGGKPHGAMWPTRRCAASPGGCWLCSTSRHSRHRPGQPAAWRRWVADSFAALERGGSLPNPEPVDRDHPALGRMARQLSLIAGALQGAAMAGRE